jgi:hypothetical protein
MPSKINLAISTKKWNFAIAFYRWSKVELWRSLWRSLSCYNWSLVVTVWMIVWHCMCFWLDLRRLLGSKLCYNALKILKTRFSLRNAPSRVYFGLRVRMRSEHFTVVVITTAAVHSTVVGSGIISAMFRSFPIVNTKVRHLWCWVQWRSLVRRSHVTIVVKPVTMLKIVIRGLVVSSNDVVVGSRTVVSRRKRLPNMLTMLCSIRHPHLSQSSSQKTDFGQLFVGLCWCKWCCWFWWCR